MSRPPTPSQVKHITGQTLIDWGFERGPWLGRGVALAREMTLRGDDEDTIRGNLRTDELESRGLDLSDKAVRRERADRWKTDFTPGVVTSTNSGTSWRAERGVHEPGTLAQLEECRRYGNVHGSALCADGHLGYAQPVGAVMAYYDQISISGVGYDIGCGNMAAKLDMTIHDLGPGGAEKLADDIVRNISFGVGRNNAEDVDHPLFEDLDAWRAGEIADLISLARAQLGTVGAGNHYVDIFTGQDGKMWIGVHFGSRGTGHKTATRYLKRAGAKDGVNVPPTVLEAGSDLGRGYIAAMQVAGQYAYAGREHVVNKIAGMIGASITDVVHNHHNYAWEEVHDGQKLWVVRKGATPAFPGQRGFVGGSMGDDAVILEGVESIGSHDMYYSTVHGAGRVLGRRKAKAQLSRETMRKWVEDKAVTLRGGGLDESPEVYRRLDDVLYYHKGTINLLDRLRPVVVVMAPENTVDPFAD